MLMRTQDNSLDIIEIPTRRTHCIGLLTLISDNNADPLLSNKSTTMIYVFTNAPINTIFVVTLSSARKYSIRLN